MRRQLRTPLQRGRQAQSGRALGQQLRVQRLDLRQGALRESTVGLGVAGHHQHFARVRKEAQCRFQRATDVRVREVADDAVPVPLPAFGPCGLYRGNRRISEQVARILQQPLQRRTLHGQDSVYPLVRVFGLQKCQQLRAIVRIAAVALQVQVFGKQVVRFQGTPADQGRVQAFIKQRDAPSATTRGIEDQHMGVLGPGGILGMHRAQAGPCQATQRQHTARRRQKTLERTAHGRLRLGLRWRTGAQSACGPMSPDATGASIGTLQSRAHCKVETRARGGTAPPAQRWRRQWAGSSVMALRRRPVPG